MAKRTTSLCLKRSCVQQRALRNLLKRACTCQTPQLYTNQVPHQSMQRQLSYRRDGQTDRRTDGQTAFQLYIATSKCTCPVVQGVGHKWMLCMVVPYKPAMCNYLSACPMDLPYLWSLTYVTIQLYSVPILPAHSSGKLYAYTYVHVVSYAYLCT